MMKRERFELTGIPSGLSNSTVWKCKIAPSLYTPATSRMLRWKAGRTLAT